MCPEPTARPHCSLLPLQCLLVSQNVKKIRVTLLSLNSCEDLVNCMFVRLEVCTRKKMAICELNTVSCAPRSRTTCTARAWLGPPTLSFVFCGTLQTATHGGGGTLRLLTLVGLGSLHSRRRHLPSACRGLGRHMLVVEFIAHRTSLQRPHDHLPLARQIARGARPGTPRPRSVAAARWGQRPRRDHGRARCAAAAAGRRRGLAGRIPGTEGRAEGGEERGAGKHMAICLSVYLSIAAAPAEPACASPSHMPRVLG